MIERVKLSEVCRIVGGSTPDSTNPNFWNGDIVWITPTDLGKLDTKEIRTSERMISEAGFKSCSTEIVPAGSVILSTRAPIGHLGLALAPLCTNQGCKAIVPGPKVDSIFLYFQLLSSVAKLQELGSGATFTELPKSKLESFEIALPPLEEQKAIASRLSQQFAAVDRARAAAEARLNAINDLYSALMREAFRVK